MKHKAFTAGAVFISILSFIPGSQLPAEPFDAADLVVHFGMYFFWMAAIAALFIGVN